MCHASAEVPDSFERCANLENRANNKLRSAGKAQCLGTAFVETITKGLVRPKIRRIAAQAQFGIRQYFPSGGELARKGALAREAPRLYPSAPLDLVPDAATHKPRMSGFMHDDRSDLFRPRRVGEYKSFVEFAQPMAIDVLTIISEQQ